MIKIVIVAVSFPYSFPPVSTSAGSDVLNHSCLPGCVSSVLLLSSLCSTFAAACTEA